MDQNATNNTDSSNNNNPPPPLPTNKTPLDNNSKSRSNPRPPLSRKTPLIGKSTPHLVRSASASVGRDRTSTSDSLHSNHSQAGLHQRRGSYINRETLFDQQQHHGIETMTTDRNMLLASLDHEAVEDEAENTLLDVLERRQVTFAANHDAVAPQRPRHRRNSSGFLSAALPSMDFLNADFSQRHFSAPASGEVAQTQRRPSLASRSQSMGKSNRNLQDCRPPSLTSSGRAATEGRTSSDSSINWAFDSQGELATSFSELSDQDERLVGVSHSGPKKEGINSDEKDSHVRPTQTENIAGRKVGLKRGDSDSSGGVPQMLTTLERARRVALTMKTSAATNHLEDELGDNADFSNLMNIMENKRDQDSASIGSQSKLGSRKSISDSQSKGGASGFSGSNIRQGRPFSGITVSPFAGGESSNIDHLFQSAEMVHDLCQIPEGEEEEGCKCAVIADANATFLSLLNRSHPEVPSAFSEENEDTPQGEDGGVDEQTPMIGRPSIQSTPRGRFKKIFSPIISSVLHPNNGLYRFLVWWTGLRRQTRMLADAFDRAYVKETCWAFFQNEVTCQIVPALSVSAFCYYQLGNPVLSILPTDASVSWWILFAIRNYLTFQLAYTVQYLFVEVLAMRSLLSVQLIGPLATLYTINAKGWPFILTSWGVLNLLLIQDNHPTSIFFNHWLSWTDIEMFSAENPSGGVVESDLYKEVLMSMIIVGISIALKRTILALYLGKRM